MSAGSTLEEAAGEAAWPWQLDSILWNPDTMVRVLRVLRVLGPR
jgi:hypothetical protein